MPFCRNSPSASPTDDSKGITWRFNPLAEFIRFQETLVTFPQLSSQSCRARSLFEENIYLTAAAAAAAATAILKSVHTG